MTRISLIITLLSVCACGQVSHSEGIGQGNPPLGISHGLMSNDTLIYKIPISLSAVLWHGDTAFYQVNDIHGSGLVDSLFDEQQADPLYGTNRSIPRSFFSSGYRTRVYYPATAVVDLGGYYKLTHEFIYNNQGNDTLLIQYGEPFHWSDDTLKRFTGGIGWRDFGATVYTRYLKIFYANKGYQKTSELVLYGYLANKDSLSRTAPAPQPLPTKTSFTMGQFMGFNQIGPREVDSVGSLMRHYQQQDWMDTVTTTHNIDSVKFVFTKFGHATNSTSTTGSAVNYFFPEGPATSRVKTGEQLAPGDLHRMALQHSGYFDATQGVPVFAKGRGKPIDVVNHPKADATDPDSYDRLARMAWNYAAYYGFEKHSPDSIQTPYPTLSGLGLRAFVETGNEMNQTWSGRKNYYTPQEFVAYSSAYYDGNLGQMGDRMGIKSADPSMKVIAAGTAGASTKYLNGIHFYSYYARKDHSVPFDILNFHSYPSNGTNGRGTNTYAPSPEEYFGAPDNVIKKYVAAANELFPGMPVWLTEWGYDRNRATKIAVPPIPGKDSTQIQADWIARFWFMLSFTGVARSTMYQLRSDAADSVGTVTFMTTGLTRGLYIGNKYTPGKYSFDWSAFPAYYFQKTIWLKLNDYKPDAIIYDNHDSIWVYRYRNAIHKDNVCYAIWSGTKTNRSTTAYSIKTGHANSRVSITKLADKQMMGITTTPRTDGQGDVPVTITETPIMLFTTGGKDGGQLVKRPSR